VTKSIIELLEKIFGGEGNERADKKTKTHLAHIELAPAPAPFAAAMYGKRTTRIATNGTTIVSSQRHCM
jgi:hypothetical protein